MNKYVILNQYEDPKLSEAITVGIGDKVFATEFAEEFGLIANKLYEILDNDGRDLIYVKTDTGKKEWFSVEYFRNNRN